MVCILSNWHDWVLWFNRETRREEWKCRRCGKIYGPYICWGLRPQGCYLMPCAPRLGGM